MATFADGIRLAWGTLTAIPAPPPRTVDAGVARVAMSLGWLVVVPVTVAASALGWGLVMVGVPPLAGGAIVIAVMQVATRAIHADGLADTADGLGSGRARDRALEIMRRSDVGPMGATALVLVLGLQVILVGDLLGRPGGWLVAGAAVAVGRLALVLACSASVPAARGDGLGSTVAGSVPTWWAVVVPLVVLVAGMVGVDAVGVAFGGDLTGVSWAWGMVVGVLASAGVLVVAVRKLGGVTGDVLGAMVEVMSVGLLLGLAIR